MDRFTPTDLRPLFPRERAELLGVLRSLGSEEWHLPTVCVGWSVHDLALHLLNGDLRFIAARRDGYQSPSGPRVEPPFGRAEVTRLVDTINDNWVNGARFLSPRQLIDQLERSGVDYAETLSTLDMNALGISVDWIESTPAPVWIDVAREYTERLIHQQQVRDATGRPLLTQRWAVYPLFDTFMLALPNALRDVDAPAGANVHLTIRGEAGCTWIVRKRGAKWEFGSDRGVAPFAAMSIDQDDAWRLFTKGLGPNVARGRADLRGDASVIDAVLEMVTILA